MRQLGSFECAGCSWRPVLQGSPDCFAILVLEVSLCIIDLVCLLCMSVDLRQPLGRKVQSFSGGLCGFWGALGAAARWSSGPHRLKTFRIMKLSSLIHGSCHWPSGSTAWPYMYCARAGPCQSSSLGA